MKKLSTTFWILAGVILLAGIFFRFWNLASDELTFDEGIYAFRSIGYLDYMESPGQVTPIEKFTDKEMPSWLKLSFHDHPPLFFFIEHLFLSIFGATIFVARLPSALAGLGSLILLFFITREIFKKLENEKLREWGSWAGLFSASIGAVSFAMVSISRLAQMEAVLFFLILLNIYLFLKLLDSAKWWWTFGISFGLCLLTKYTAVFLVPTYFLYLFIIGSPLLKNWRWYAGFVIAGILFSPVIVYNILLYKTFGHFDLQFAYLFNQATPEWQGIGGKNQEPFVNILANLKVLYSIPFLVLTATGLCFGFFRKNLGKARLLGPFSFIFTLLLLIAVGSAFRFIALLVIPSILLVTTLFFAVGERFKKPFTIIAILSALLILSESYFTTNLILKQKADYGIAKLDAYFGKIIGDARPAGLVKNSNTNLNKVIEEYATNRPGTLPLLGIIYDDEISAPARLWLFGRRQYYQGIPTMPASQFLRILQEGRGDIFKGFQTFLVKARPATTISPVSDKTYVTSLENFIKKLPAKTKFVILGGEQAPAFEVAQFSFN